MSGNISINFKPSKKQFEAYTFLTDKNTHYIGYGGAAFSGKSYLLCYWITIMCIAYPGTAWGIGRKQITVLKKTTVITLFKVFTECGISIEDYSYNQQLNTIELFNGSSIYLIDTARLPSDPLFTRFGGLELTGAAVDESAETEYEAIEVLSTRLGRRLNDKYKLTAKLLETFNPAKNHVYSRYYKPYKDNRQRKQHVFIPALPSDNPSDEVPAYIERIKSTASKVTIERLIYGNFEYDDDPSALMSIDDINNVFTNKFVKGGKRYITADIARFGDDSTMIGVWDGLRLIKYVELTKKPTTWVTSQIMKLAQEYEIPLSQIIVDEDGVGGGVVDQLGCKGFVNNSSPLYAENFNNLKSQCYFKLADIVRANLMFVASDDPEFVARLIEEFEQVKQKDMDKDGKKQVVPKDKVKELLGRSPDISDMVMMRMYWEIKHKVAEDDFFVG